MDSGDSDSEAYDHIYGTWVEEKMTESCLMTWTSLTDLVSCCLQPVQEIPLHPQVCHFLAEMSVYMSWITDYCRLFPVSMTSCQKLDQILARFLQHQCPTMCQVRCAVSVHLHVFLCLAGTFQCSVNRTHLTNTHTSSYQVWTDSHCTRQYCVFHFC